MFCGDPRRHPAGRGGRARETWPRAGGSAGGKGGEKVAYHQQRPDAVVGEDDRGSHEHGEADEFLELRKKECQLDVIDADWI